MGALVEIAAQALVALSNRAFLVFAVVALAVAAIILVSLLG